MWSHSKPSCLGLTSLSSQSLSSFSAVSNANISLQTKVLLHPWHPPPPQMLCFTASLCIWGHFLKKRKATGLFNKMKCSQILPSYLWEEALKWRWWQILQLRASHSSYRDLSLIPIQRTLLPPRWSGSRRHTILSLRLCIIALDAPMCAKSH